MSIRAVVFDAVGTLLHPWPGVASQYAAAGRRFGFALTEDDVRLRFATAFQRQEACDRAADWITDERREVERWRAIVTDVFGDDRCLANLMEVFARPDAWRIAEGAEELIAVLRRRGLRVALASNFDSRLHGVVARRLDLDAVFVSSELGVRKPSPRFFHTVAECLGVAANEIVFVGDDAVNDDATSAGMRSLILGRDLESIVDVVRALNEPVE